MQNCPCGSNNNYTDCCGIYITGKQAAPTAEALMRSRYTAYTQANIEYIARTMKAPANNNFDPDDARLWAQQVDWKKLEVMEVKPGANKSFVEFLVFYYHNNERLVLHEISEFDFIDGQWFYVNGKAPDKKSLPFGTKKLARNDPCSCGSNKKYKKCCGANLS